MGARTTPTSRGAVSPAEEISQIIARAERIAGSGEQHAGDIAAGRSLGERRRHCMIHRGGQRVFLGRPVETDLQKAGMLGQADILGHMRSFNWRGRDYSL